MCLSRRDRDQMKSCGIDIKIDGQVLRVARPELEKYELLDNPQAVIEDLRLSGVRIDLFTFLRIQCDNPPNYPYTAEPENMAVLPVSTFDHWWTKQIRSEARNRARQAEKKGVTVREVSFDDAFVQGIWAIYNETQIRQGKRNVHYGKDRETVRREAATF